MQFSTSDLVIFIASIFISISFHEAMHAFTSHWLGDPTAKDLGRVTLNPLKHINLYTTVLLPTVLILMHLPPILIAQPVPFDPTRLKFEEYGAALVALAGPFTNLLLATVVAVLLRLFNMPIGLTHALLIFVEVNVLVFVFNMIPFPPLDGSRLLYAFAPESVQKVMYSIESMGYVAIMILFILFVLVLAPVISYVSIHVLHLLLGGIYPL